MSRIAPPGQNKGTVFTALSKYGEATCAELARYCGITETAVNSAINKLHAAGEAHVSRWAHVGAKGAFTRVWTLGPGQDAPRPTPKPRYIKKPKSLPFGTDERTPDLPTSYAFKSVFAGGKNPWLPKEH